jgi:enterobactin synthetase component D
VRATGDDDGGVLPPALAAKLIFSAKEAAFKAQFPLTGLWLDYTEVALRLSPQGFTLTLGETPLHGRWTLTEGLFVTVLVIGAAEARGLPVRKAQLPPV